MKTIRRIQARLRDESGIATLWTVITIPAFLALIALVVDGAGKVQANQQAYSTAAGAARAAANAVSSQAIVNGSTLIDSGVAAAAANSYLAAAGVGGGVSVNGSRITVTVTDSHDFTFLPGGATVQASATAQLITQ